MTDLDTTCINTLRFLSVDAVEKAKSGHPGLPLGAAPMAYVLWDRFLRHNPADPNWPNRDRFVLSAGHGSALLYSLLHATGYPLSLEDLQQFRQWGSRTPGHPEHGHTPGVEATTGPLGQGFAMGVGMAIAESHLASVFNRTRFPLVDHFTYVLASDGDLMEGIASEAASLAGTLGLGKLICLYDDNHVSLEGPTIWAFTEDVARRFDAYGWQVLRVSDGNDLGAIDAALNQARADTGRPSLICVRTHIGYGSPVQDTREAHGEALGPANLKSTKERLGWPLEPTFLVPPEALAHFRLSVERGATWQRDWELLRERYRAEYRDEARTFEAQIHGALPEAWDATMPAFAATDPPVATRDASQKVLNAIAPRVPALLGGAADLSPSTKTLLPNTGDYAAGEPAGRNFHFGVREHAMFGLLNGMSLHGGVLPYGATFLIFSDYARGSIRLAALQQTHAIFIFTHDSIALGEDGPTHQPIEQLASLRAIPGMRVLRPADANETVAAWRISVEGPGPSALILTRQKLPILDANKHPVAQGVRRGAYVLSEAEGGAPQVVLMATGSEVATVLEAQEKLRAGGVRARVVSFPCWQLFDAQTVDYQSSVLPAGIPRISLEAAATMGWRRFVGERGECLGVDRFGASAPGPTVLKELGITSEHVVQAALRWVPANAPGAPSP